MNATKASGEELLVTPATTIEIPIVMNGGLISTPVYPTVGDQRSWVEWTLTMDSQTFPLLTQTGKVL